MVMVVVRSTCWSQEEKREDSEMRTSVDDLCCVIG
jgi:hypothetical protein